ncbi:nucleoside-diphosphate kinase [Mesorhizobium sp. NBSH29]|uniref:nucleoside-diphosphate kinase n=1 Tax=Mesorhizobium sp. NBSH29 TaxID=2654249 RepID=UPI0018964CC2|nr:nucleoside-diphosphate kinase [Mesorhizobium sp. NBSH29]QPC85925.1 nucleoside-diphosphate kinase [Mesorhizobium sp. NBSH29]
MNTVPRLTTKDYAILETMLDRCCGRGDPMEPLLRRKLGAALVRFREDIEADVVTLNSRVVFRVDDGAPLTRILVQGEIRALVGMTIPIGVPRGLSMLGHRAGDTVAVAKQDGSAEHLFIEAIAFQPEAAQRRVAHSHVAGRTGAPFLRLVSSSNIPVRPASIPPPAIARNGPDDDPGPSAA